MSGWFLVGGKQGGKKEGGRMREEDDGGGWERMGEEVVFWGEEMRVLFRLRKF